VNRENTIKHQHPGNLHPGNLQALLCQQNKGSNLLLRRTPHLKNPQLSIDAHILLVFAGKGWEDKPPQHRYMLCWMSIRVSGFKFLCMYGLRTVIWQQTFQIICRCALY
jgi:hypothetical protein